MSCLLTLLYLHSSLSDPVPTDPVPIPDPRPHPQPMPDPRPHPQPMPDPPPDEEPIKMSHQTRGSARIRAC
ncbi:hypothetical protein IRR91_003452 [Salmonella enterica]|nr:hypothetical protein [Salmonella enterica]EAN8612831.1 hypothetical protein [Salmonella enterica subsp. arizonae serovar 48:z4,z24:-]EAO5936965.1 hypothetical protein [Salmonella enterica subsp. houtenae serovar 48:g,z51:-]EBP3815958.1 hypothetical protein [Salmonella enterica subsp. enterica]ECP3269375.1 hypothetical protein [Salmonella enterica subsp. enterica serovar [1],13,23:g,z51:-]EDT2393684.1 hypothetical protein [Salmonella enterica subsp. arizonae]